MRRKRFFLSISVSFRLHSVTELKVDVTMRAYLLQRALIRPVLYFPSLSHSFLAFLSFCSPSLLLSLSLVILFVFGLCVRVKLVKTATQTLHYSSSCPTCYCAASRAITHKRVKKEGSLSLFLSSSIPLFFFSLSLFFLSLLSPSPSHTSSSVRSPLLRLYFCHLSNIRSSFRVGMSGAIC